MRKKRTKEEINKKKNFFFSSYVGIYTPEQFLIVRRCAFDQMAFAYVDHFRSKQETFDKWIVNTMKSENFKVEIARSFHQVSTSCC